LPVQAVAQAVPAAERLLLVARVPMVDLPELSVWVSAWVARPLVLVRSVVKAATLHHLPAQWGQDWALPERMQMVVTPATLAGSVWALAARMRMQMQGDPVDQAMAT
jgi:hypothetical protein